jgi:CHAT domain-containing protein/Tfp pilus assembly protein PilF
VDTSTDAGKSGPVVGIVLVALLLGSIPGYGVPQSGADSYASAVDSIRSSLRTPEYTHAVTRSRALLAQVEQDGAATPSTIASILDVLVEALLNSGDRGADATIALARRAAALKEQLVGAADPRAAHSRLNLGSVLAGARQFPEARQVLDSALGVFTRTSGAEHELTGRTLSELSFVVRALGDTPRARSYAEQAVATLERVLGREDVAVARALTNRGSARDDVKGALEDDRRAIEILRKAYRGDHPRLALTLGNYAWKLDEAGAFKESEAAHRESVAMYERTVSPDSPDLAWELNNFGLLYWRLVDYQAAMPLFERALAIWTAASSPDASRALNNLASSSGRLGHFAAARSYYERSLAIKEKTFGPDHPEAALVVYNLANLIRAMGDYSAALPLYERALRIREKHLGPDHRLTAYALSSLGEVQLELGFPARARELNARALQIWRAQNAPEVGVALAALGDIERRAGDRARALAYYDEARAIYEKTFGPDHADVAALLNNSATMASGLGDFENATKQYARALDITERQFNADHPSIAEIAAGLATVEWQRGDTSRALQYALRSERISREHFRLTSRTLSEREAIAFGEKRAPALDVLMTLAIAGGVGPDDRRSIMDAAIRSRALVLDEIASRGRFRGGAEGGRLVDNVVRTRQRLANLLVRGARPGDASYAELVAAAKAERDASERALAAASATEREQLAREHAGLAEVVSAMTADASLVTFVTYSHLTPGTVPADDDRRYAALIARGQSNVVDVVPMGTVAAIDAKVARWRRAVSPRTAAAPSERTYAPAAQALSAAIWTPIAPYVRDTGRLFVVPDGALNLVTFAALPDGAGRYLVESAPMVHYLTAERDLVTSPLERTTARSLLALGNPAYTLAGMRPAASGAAATRRGATACPEFRQVRFDRLTHTVREIDDISGLWKAQNAGDARQLSGEGATESAFKRAAPNARVLHLATHGFFLGSCGGAENTRGVGGLAGAKPRRDAPQSPVIPLSGLALAGANQRATAGSDDDDGILTAEEVVGLDLHEVEWAVLSACDTGLGEVRAGEGVFGLRRGFAAAGVRTTIMSLWSVEDRAARDWMIALYRSRLVDGRSTIEAVTDASRSVLQARRARGASTHPFYWAAFVAAGDWR